MLSIGITGGIGSGKSTVCKVFSVLGIPVFQADLVARKLQNEDPLIIEGLKEIFGNDIYNIEGQLDRRRVADLIFNNKELLSEINHLIHPAVHLTFEQWKSNNKNVPYVVYEAAVLYETGRFRFFDYTVLVVTDESERIARIRKRDLSSEESIRQRMKNQMKDAEKMKLADFIIENNDNQMIIPQILKLDTIFKARNHVW